MLEMDLTYDVSQANNLDDAWINFDPMSPLPDQKHPFYVCRPGEPLKRLTHALRLSSGKASSPPKFFFTGYRGSGKSTELNIAAADADLQNYWIVQYSIQEVSDTHSLDYTDILLSLAAKIYHQYEEYSGQVDKDLIQELDTWKNRTIERLREKGAVFEGESSAGLNAFFLTAMLKLKTDHSTRVKIREDLQPRVSELIEKINLLITQVELRYKKQVLVLIDDLDKVSMEIARRIFHENLSALMQPKCAIVFTISYDALYEEIFMDPALYQNTYLLPNIRLHPHGDRQTKEKVGYDFCREIITKRMQTTLIEEGLLDRLIALCGGVPSDLVFVMRTAISNAQHRGSLLIQEPDLFYARSQLRNPLLRLLSDNDLDVLRDIYSRMPERLKNPKGDARLIYIRAALQYANGEEWFDTHPVLEELFSNEPAQP